MLIFQNETTIAAPPTVVGGRFMHYYVSPQMPETEICYYTSEISTSLTGL